MIPPVGGAEIAMGAASAIGGGTSGVDSTTSTATGNKTFNTGPGAAAGVSGSGVWLLGGVAVVLLMLMIKR